MKSKWNYFNYMVNEINSVYHEMSVKLGVSDSEFMILYILNENSLECNQSEIYKNSGISRKTINSALQKMRAAGYLTISQADGRNTLVSITDKGKVLIKEVVEPIVKAENDMYDSWSEEEIEIYHNLTHKYLIEIKEKAKVLVKRNEKGNIINR